MTDFYELVAQVQPHAPDAPLPIMLDCIRRSATKYCMDSDSYRYIPDMIPSIANVAYYDLPLPSQTVLSRVVNARYKDRVLQPTSSILRNVYGQLGTPHYFQQQGNRIRLVDPAPATEMGAFSFELALKPSFSATMLEDNYFSEHAQGISYGALQYVLAQSGVSWANPGLAGYYAGLFDEAIRVAKRRANNDDTAKCPETAYGGY